MPPKFAARQLAYEPPPVPSFLQKLHSQVNQNRASIEDKRAGGREDAPTEFDTLLGIGTSSLSSSTSGKVSDNSRVRKADNSGLNDWDDAQIVVLEEGKHLSREEAAGANKDKPGEELVSDDRKQGVVAGPQAAPSSIAGKRSKTSATNETKPNELEEVKKIIERSRNGKEGQEVEDDAVNKDKRKQEKERLKEEKNKRARIEKSKRGKGLSFNMDD